MEKIIKAIILARVSTDEQKEAGNSLPAQIERMKSYCEHRGLKVVEEYSFDESAYKTKRDEFDKILDYLKKHKEKIAVCFDKVDRLSRNVFDKRVSELYDKAVADEIELHFVSDGQVINNAMSAVQKFQFGMSLGLAKYFSDAISDNVKRAYEKMRREGIWTNRPPLGYIRAADKNIIPDPERSHLIIKMFELYSTGNYSLNTLLEEVMKMGLRSSGGLKIPRSAIAKCLKNPFYCGTAISRECPPYKHKYECLISRGLFEKCQEVSGKKRTNRPKFVGKNFIFGGLLCCKNCGCLYTPEMHQKKSGLIFIHYSCTNAKGICHRDYTSEGKLLEQVYEDFEDLVNISEEDQAYLVNELQQTTESEVAFYKAQVSRIQKEKDHMKQKGDNLVEAFLEKSISKETYNQKRQEYQEKSKILEIELERHGKSDHDYQTTVATVFSLARRAKEIFDGSEPNEKKAFLNYLLQNPTVDVKKLEYSLRSPFNLLLEHASSPSMGG